MPAGAAEVRRGRSAAAGPSRAPGTLLLLIDFLNFLDFPTADALAPHALDAARNAARLKARLARVGVPVIYANDNFGRWESDIRAIVATCRVRGGASRRLVELLEPRDGERSVLKPRHSAFFGTPLEFLLDELAVDRLVLAGLTADSCVMFTAHDAYVRGYGLWIPPDCVASADPRHARDALGHMQRVLKASVAASTARLAHAWPVGAVRDASAPARRVRRRMPSGGS